MVVKRNVYYINDNLDMLIEILKRLDGRSLGVAACVCRLWSALARHDSLWEHLCFRHLSPPPHGVRAVVAALGGYRSFYMLCFKPVGAAERRLSTRHEMDISLSLFCVDYYERVLLAGAARIPPAPSPPLIFLCNV
ncbi:F-box protein SNE-like [Salvia miltiorrhiza]|uniref:F-box protein SNE-like n=1 Tax=Salvia miltiorrhiza TaxID=226208 RepID=UPI0025AC74CE|nr:F-box protein SNE-like [Salvia miltiorrhiza]